MSMCRLGICLGDDGIIMIRANVKRFRDLKSIGWDESSLMCAGVGRCLTFSTVGLLSISLSLLKKYKEIQKREWKEEEEEIKNRRANIKYN